MFKKPVQQGRALLGTSRRASPLLGARSVHEVREHDKGPRTPLAGFFNTPSILPREQDLGTLEPRIGHPTSWAIMISTSSQNIVEVERHKVAPPFCEFKKERSHALHDTLSVHYKVPLPKIP